MFYVSKSFSGMSSHKHKHNITRQKLCVYVLCYVYDKNISVKTHSHLLWLEISNLVGYIPLQVFSRAIETLLQDLKRDKRSDRNQRFSNLSRDASVAGQHGDITRDQQHHDNG